MTSVPKHRWFSFSLRTLFAVASLAASGQAADVRQPDELFITGRIQDEHGQAIAGADVALMVVEDVNNQSLENHPFAVTVQSDERGDYRLPLPEPLKKEWGTVWAHATGYGPMRRRETSSLLNYAKGRAVNLQLEAAERTVVRLLDGHKQPVSDAVVRALHVRVKESIGWPIPVDWADRFRATTDREGLATIVSFVPASLDRVRIDATASGRVEFDQNFFLNVRPREQAPNFDLPVPDSGRVEGQLNVSGADAPDIRELTLRTEVVPSFGPSVGVWGLADIAAEASGQFVVKNIAPGKLTAKLAMPENEPWRARVPGNLNVVAGKTTDLVIPVEPAVRVEGLICKQDTGQGYPDFSLSVIYGPSAKTHNNMDNQVEVKTDRDGKFSAYVPPGPIELRLHSAPQDYHQVEWWEGRSRGGRWGSRREVPEGVTKFELEPIGLAPAERVEGTLVDKDGNPLPGWMVFGFPEDKAAGPEHVRQKIEPMNSFGGVDTDQAGRFTGYVPKPYPPVRWKIMHTLGNENYKRRTDHYRATITSKRPLVLQVDVDKPTESTQSR